MTVFLEIKNVDEAKEVFEFIYNYCKVFTATDLFNSVQK